MNLTNKGWGQFCECYASPRKIHCASWNDTPTFIAFASSVGKALLKSSFAKPRHDDIGDGRQGKSIKTQNEWEHVDSPSSENRKNGLLDYKVNDKVLTTTAAAVNTAERSQIDPMPS
ncbi:hypothetical protein LOAG_02726 [Loa loa]|uniref:Uncharacterized protein n=1 Tax=Loa loa TaxID=7209 RepID=A0A1S0U5U6_LOALO|nr:hypothetical protein LOAG_02726 [Loa loa]EFO25765.1 hypothetical protein LOAG_02726 [Loa loa]